MTRVRDIMRTELITVSPSTSVREVAQILVRESVSGLPVVEEDGEVVGVVSASDIVRIAAREPEAEIGFELRRTPELEWDEGEGDDLGQPGGFYVPEVIPEWVRPVLLGDALDDMDAATIMTPATFFVRPELTLRELADFLVRGRIHRALVLEHGKLVGIVTSFDALRALADARNAAA